MNDDFIYIQDNFLTKEECNRIIDQFEKLDQNNHTWDRISQGVTRLYQDDQACNLTLYEEKNFAAQEIIVAPVMAKFWDNVYKPYANKYASLVEHDKHQIYHFKIQRSQPGQGYHNWHCENNRVHFAKRLLTFIIYLNDIEEGGETEFLYYKKRVKAETGKIVLFPCHFTHTHRGNPPLKETKYIITTWIEY